jgi:hypothetical protein
MPSVGGRELTPDEADESTREKNEPNTDVSGSSETYD